MFPGGKRPLHCDKCNIRFQSLRDFQAHVSSYCTEMKEPEFPCSKCECEFNLHADLETHLELAHAPVKRKLPTRSFSSSERSSSIECSSSIESHSSIKCNSSIESNSSIKCNSSIESNSSIKCSSSIESNSSIKCSSSVERSSSIECLSNEISNLIEDYYKEDDLFELSTAIQTSNRKMEASEVFQTVEQTSSSEQIHPGYSGSLPVVDSHGEKISTTSVPNFNLEVAGDPISEHFTFNQGAEASSSSSLETDALNSGDSPAIEQFNSHQETLAQFSTSSDRDSDTVKVTTSSGLKTFEVVAELASAFNSSPSNQHQAGTSSVKSFDDPITRRHKVIMEAKKSRTNKQPPSKSQTWSVLLPSFNKQRSNIVLERCVIQSQLPELVEREELPPVLSPMEILERINSRHSSSNETSPENDTTETEEEIVTDEGINVTDEEINVTDERVYVRDQEINVTDEEIDAEPEDMDLEDEEIEVEN